MESHSIVKQREGKMSSNNQNVTGETFNEQVKDFLKDDIV